MDIGTNYSHLYSDNCKNKKRNIYTDSVCGKKSRRENSSMDGLQRAMHYTQNKKNNVVVLKNLRSDVLDLRKTEKYIETQKQRQRRFREQYVQMQNSRMDGVHVNAVRGGNVSHTKQSSSTSAEISLQDRIQNTYNAFASYRKSIGENFDFSINMSPVRMWQLSLTGAMIFGMISMSLIYRNLGQNALAKEDVERSLALVDEKKIAQVVDDTQESGDEENEEEVEREVVEEKEAKSFDSAVKKVEKEIEKEEKESEVAVVAEKKSIDSAVKKVEKAEETEESDDSQEEKDGNKENASVEDERAVVEEVEDEEKTLEDLAYETVEGYPIEKMLPYILDQDPEVAKYLIAIAKQESAWGKRVPVLNGQDCYNYWGYRGIRKLMGSGGHTCFNSRKDAVETVGKRLKELIYDYDRGTADRLIVWKCGSSCAGHSQAGVDRWIGVVDTYYDKLSQE